jgi:hypothetical protein
MQTAESRVKTHLMQAQDKKRIRRTTPLPLTHFIKRMLPGEYCTKSVFTRWPQPTQRGASPSVSASAITLNLFAQASEIQRWIKRGRVEAPGRRERQRDGRERIVSHTYGAQWGAALQLEGGDEQRPEAGRRQKRSVLPACVLDGKHLSRFVSNLQAP